ncbi:MAG TPA: methionine--tRNA ligase [Nitrososphaerales archaeon]|nr:methionine--tRNA ligase [Nitrososphaerales archaeon]
MPRAGRSTSKARARPRRKASPKARPRPRAKPKVKPGPRGKPRAAPKAKVRTMAEPKTKTQPKEGPMERRRVLVCCALPYTNAVPHVGNIVGSHLPADIFARYCRLKGYETVFVGGADENGTPTEVAALELKVTPRALTDVFYNVHKTIYDWFEISYDNFSRTSLPVHYKTTQDLFLKIYEKGYVTKGVMRLPYCETDKLFLADRYVSGTCPVCGYQFARGDQCENCATLLDPSQLINPKCKIDGSDPVFRDSDNLFLELEKLQSNLEEWITSQTHWRKQVSSLALGWIHEGLKKRSITRDLKWGVPVPLKGFEDKIFYVWFDAPIGYLSFTKEWAEKRGTPNAWEDYWVDPKARIYNFLGKDNIPFHTIFWPGMLMAYGGLNLPYDVVGLQYCNYEGDKISKSKNWGIFCEKVVESGLDPDVWRYYLTYLIPETRDTEFKWDDFQSRVNNELVAAIGNFFHRTITFASNFLSGAVEKAPLGPDEKEVERLVLEQVAQEDAALQEARIKDALKNVLKVAMLGNEYFQKCQPWVLIKEDRKRCEQVIYCCLNVARALAVAMAPFLPSASAKAFSYLGLSEAPSFERSLEFDLGAVKVEKPEILFRKIDDREVARLKATVTKSSDAKEFFRD